MSDSMIEHVARALKPKHFEIYDQGFPTQNRIDQQSFLNSEKVVRRARKDARAAIEAMREPTEAMIDAAKGSYVEAFAAMIDAAIKEPPT